MAATVHASDQIAIWREMASTFPPDDPLSGVLSKSFYLLQALSNNNSSVEEFEFALASVESERQLAKKYDKNASDPFRKMVYGLIECIGTATQTLNQEGRIRFGMEIPSSTLASTSTETEEPETRSTSAYGSQNEIPFSLAAVKEELMEEVEEMVDQSASLPDNETVWEREEEEEREVPNSSDRLTRSAKKRGLATVKRECSPPTALSPLPPQSVNGSPSSKRSRGKRGDAEMEMPLFKRELGDEIQENLKAFSDIEDEEKMDESQSFSTIDIEALLRQMNETPSDKGSAKKQVRTPAQMGFNWEEVQNSEGKTLYKCVLCLKLFTHIHNLKTHMRSHRNDRRFLCEICNTKFMRQEHLARHQRNGLCTSRPFGCTICLKRFDNEQRLKDHTILHQHEKLKKEEAKPVEKYEKINGEYHCPDCTNKYQYECHLRRHVRSHTGEKPFVCEVCGKGFIQMTALNHHRALLHTGERPYECTLCDQAFHALGPLNAHLRKKHGEHIYTCDKCGIKMATIKESRTHKVTCQMSDNKIDLAS